MTGLTLWADAGTNMRRLFIRLACDGDIRRFKRYEGPVFKLTVAQALEVLK